MPHDPARLVALSVFKPPGWRRPGWHHHRQGPSTGKPSSGYLLAVTRVRLHHAPFQAGLWPCDCCTNPLTRQLRTLFSGCTGCAGVLRLQREPRGGCCTSLSFRLYLCTSGHWSQVESSGRFARAARHEACGSTFFRALACSAGTGVLVFCSLRVVSLARVARVRACCESTRCSIIAGVSLNRRDEVMGRRYWSSPLQRRETASACTLLKVLMAMILLYFASHF